MKLVVLLLLALLIVNIAFGDGMMVFKLSEAFQYSTILQYLLTAIGSVLFTIILMSVLFDTFKLFKLPRNDEEDQESGVIAPTAKIAAAPEDDLFIEDLD